MRNTGTEGHRKTWMWIGIAAGAAAGVIFAVKRRARPHDRWSEAKSITRRVADHSGDLAGRGKEIINRVQSIYEEGRKVVDDAVELWEHGRKLVRA
ncbi:MAG: hypothetical protein ACE15B_00955 [Bryobacteraceae bacterium]